MYVVNKTKTLKKIHKLYKFKTKNKTTEKYH